MREVSPLELAASMTEAARTAGANDPQVHGADWQTAVVTAVNVDGTVDVGSIRARRLLSYSNPAVADLIAITQNGAGNWIALGRLAPAVSDEWTAYTPTVAGGGTATFTSRVGWYAKSGGRVFFGADIVVNAAGNGVAAVTVTAPSNIYRTTRQVFPCHSQSTTTAGAVMNGHAVALETGTGAVIDRISLSNDGAANRDNILNGTNLLTGARISITGWYREA